MTSVRDQLEPLIRAAGVREVARRAGIPQPRLSEWLNGRANLTVARAEVLAAAVGAEVRVVANGSTHAKAPGRGGRSRAAR